MKVLTSIIVFLTFISAVTGKNKSIEANSYLSPSHICVDKNSGLAYVSLSTAGKIAIVDLNDKQELKYLDLGFDPGGIILSDDSSTLIIADRKPEGKVHLLSLENKEIIKSIKVGHTPDALSKSRDGSLVFVANRFSNSISVIDYHKRKLIKEIPVDRDPKSMSLSPDGKILAVGNNIPNLKATEEFISATVSLIDVPTLQAVENVSLANGTQSIEGLVFSNDGNYLYVSHILSRNKLPTTQIERGWINSNAVSIIDIRSGNYYTTLLLDNFNRGAANPSGMVVSEDGNCLYVALSGVHEICKLDLKALHQKLSGNDESELADVATDLRFLNGIKDRFAVKGKSPRHLSVYNGKLLVSSYFSKDLEVFETPGKSHLSSLISLGEEREMDDIRRGELLFSDADLCFQKWQSCKSCHPDARSDGLNWDLLNDGAGSPNNTKSMLYSHYTPPVMISGVRKDAETAVRAGLKFALFSDYKEEDARDIDSYLKSLKPVPSPFLINGKLSKKAKRGRSVFEKAGCGDCHSGTYYTDGNKYDVGTSLHPNENARFDVPGLSEAWRTAPYLYDGRAKTMNEVIKVFNPNDQHGQTSKLTEEEIECLIEYVLSL